MGRMDEARQFVRNRVLEPALEHPTLDQEIKNKVANSSRWLDHFTHVGDLLVYLKRFEGQTDAPTYKSLHEVGLETFEDIVGDFEARFSAWADDRSSLEALVIGEQYSSHDILILVGKYDTRAGGMFLLGETPPSAVVIKATLSGGMYNNEWIEPHIRLKYLACPRFHVHLVKVA